jgi:hypothetical protein
VVRKPTCFCDLFAGFSNVAFLELRSQDDGSLVMRNETRPRIVGYPTCGSIAQSKGRSPVELIDLECFGRATRTIWVKPRYACVDEDCDQATWTEVDDDRAGALVDDDAGGTLGHRPGRPVCSKRQRGRHRVGV